MNTVPPTTGPGSESLITEGHELRAAERALHCLRPAALARGFGVTVVVYTLASLLLVTWGEGGLPAILDPGVVSWPRVLLAASAVGLANSLLDLWHARRVLRRTRSELDGRVRTSIRILSGPAWPLRLAGFGAGLGVLFGLMAGTIAWLADPDSSFAGWILEAASLGAVVAVPLVLLLRFPALWLIRRRLEEDA